MRINVEYSTQHWIFPIITIGILVILGALLIALEGRARIKAGKGFFVKPGRFFVEHYDKFKFWGTIALMVVYFFLLAFRPLTGVTLSALWLLVIPIVMCSSATTAEVFRSGVLSLPAGQREAAQALGLTPHRLGLVGHHRARLNARARCVEQCDSRANQSARQEHTEFVVHVCLLEYAPPPRNDVVIVLAPL